VSHTIARMQALLQAFKRFTGTPGMADAASFEAQDEDVMGAPIEGREDNAIRDQPAALDDPCPTTPISVVVANCRGPEATARCLAAVLAQRFDAHSFEVIIVDATASDDVRALVEALTPVGGAPAVRYLRAEDGGRVAGRNDGWRAATGAVIAYTDDRSMPDPDWLAGGERAMRAGHVALGGSVCVPASKQPTAAQLAELLTASAFLRRDTLERVGGFDERCVTV